MLLLVVPIRSFSFATATWLHVTSLTLPAPCISESCIKTKINLKFFFHISLWCLKRFYEGRKGTTKKCENKNLSGIGTGRVKGVEYSFILITAWGRVLLTYSQIHGTWYFLVNPFYAIWVHEWTRINAHQWAAHYKADLDFTRSLENDGQHGEAGGDGEQRHYFPTSLLDIS